MARATVIKKEDGGLELQCPAGHRMVLRNGKYGRFYGCSEYPRCKNTIDYRDAERLIAEFKDGPSKPTEFKASEFQLRIFEWVEFWTKPSGLGPDRVAFNASNHLIVKADAGSGKTTTGVQLLNLIPKECKTLFCCFNVTIARELAHRAPAHVRVGTLHSIGFSALKQFLPTEPEVDDSKVWNIMKDILVLDEDGHYIPLDPNLFVAVRKLVGLTKATLTDPTDEVALEAIASRYGVELNGDASTIISVVPQIIKLCLERTYVIDYDDMVWLPVVMDLPMGHYDWVFVDETQDLNKCNLELVKKLVNSSGHVIAVGDEKQSIYGFRGADVDAIPNIIKALDADTLPLSISYRNAIAILDLVRDTFPYVTTQPAPWAAEGVVRDTSYNKAMAEAIDGDLILCRVNAPLVTACYAFIREGKKAVIRGRDIGKSLLSFIDKLEPEDLRDLIGKIQEYKWEQAAKLEATGKEDRIQALYDRCDTLEALCEGSRDLMDLRFNIDKIFNDVQKKGIILSSVHRAKGDEADRVYILNPELMPHPLATADWQIQQEENIKYVAYTRAKNELVFVN